MILKRNSRQSTFITMGRKIPKISKRHNPGSTFVTLWIETCMSKISETQSQVQICSCVYRAIGLPYFDHAALPSMAGDHSFRFYGVNIGANYKQ